MLGCAIYITILAPVLGTLAGFALPEWPYARLLVLVMATIFVEVYVWFVISKKQQCCDLANTDNATRKNSHQSAQGMAHRRYS